MNDEYYSNVLKTLQENPDGLGFNKLLKKTLKNGPSSIPTLREILKDMAERKIVECEPKEHRRGQKVIWKVSKQLPSIQKFIQGIKEQKKEHIDKYDSMEKSIGELPVDFLAKDWLRWEELGKHDWSFSRIADLVGDVDPELLKSMPSEFIRDLVFAVFTEYEEVIRKKWGILDRNKELDSKVHELKQEFTYLVTINKNAPFLTMGIYPLELNRILLPFPPSARKDLLDLVEKEKKTRNEVNGEVGYTVYADTLHLLKKIILNHVKN